MTHETDYSTAPAEIRAITDELWALYGHHPSLAGFYSYQEGSGTYLVPTSATSAATSRRSTRTS